ncbi:hypothetical protein V8E36_000525 [Tilletia maclaganii]
MVTTVPTHPFPDQPIDSAAAAEPTASSSRRIQPDRDDDFFLRRKVIRNIETNPPRPDPVELDESDEEKQADGDYRPKRAAAALPAANRSAQATKKKEKSLPHKELREVDEDDGEQGPDDQDGDDSFEAAVAALGTPAHAQKQAPRREEEQEQEADDSEP